MSGSLAESSLLKKLDADQENLDALKSLAQICAKEDRRQEALNYFRRALAIAPQNCDCLKDLGSFLQNCSAHVQAASVYRQAIESEPDNAEHWNNLGICLYYAKDYEESLQSFTHATRLDPTAAQSWNNQGNVLRRLGRSDEARQAYLKAIAQNASYAEAWNNLGVLMHENLRLEAATEHFLKAIALVPDYADARWNLSQTQLLSGDYAKGWVNYESRWLRPSFTSPRRRFPCPLWRGETLEKDKALFLHCEQGYGDTLHFARYLPLVLKRAQNITVAVQQPLISLFKQTWPNLNIVDGERQDQDGDFDFHCPFLTLPLALGVINKAPKPFNFSLRPDIHEKWAKKVGRKKRKRIGFAWKGSPTHHNDHQRSLPLSSFLDLLPAKAELWCLQKDLTEEERAALSERNILIASDSLGDFMDTAALCALLDEIVCVDTSLAHLAGSMGKSVRILLPFCPDWRWLLDRSNTPLYPSAKLYRQKQQNDWQEAFKDLRADLQLL